MHVASLVLIGLTLVGASYNMGQDYAAPNYVSPSYAAPSHPDNYDHAVIWTPISCTSLLDNYNLNLINLTKWLFFHV